MELRELFAEHGDLSAYPPERRILIGALECIRESGLERTTVRAIAAKARVNPAAIAYYYRSKDRAIEAALRSAWTHVAQDIDRIMKETADRESAARLAVQYLMEGASGSSRIIRAVIVDHPALRSEAAAFLRSLFERIERGSGQKGGQKSRLTALLLLALSVLVAVAPDAAAALSGVDLSDPKARQRLWGKIGDSLLPSGRGKTHQNASPRLK